MEIVAVQGHKKEGSGKNYAKQVRRSGLVPANMYKSGGENIYPAEIERILVQMEGILEVAVVGVPDEKWGEVGKAFIVTTHDHPKDEQAILDYCRQHLAKFKVPKHIQFTEAIPKSDSGKINRNLLKKL